MEGLDGRLEEAERLFQEAGGIRDALGDRRGQAWAALGWSQMLMLHDRWDGVLERLEAARSVFHDVGDQFGIENTAGGIAAVEYRRGRLDRAEAMMRETLAANDFRPAPGSLVAIAGFPTLALARGDPIRSLRLWGAVENLREELTAMAPLALLPLGDTRSEATARVDPKAATAALDERRRMSFEEATRFAAAGG